VNLPESDGNERNAACTCDLVPFYGGAEVEDGWPSFESNFYWDEAHRVWVYKFADERIIAAVRDGG
jgi:hypothetical protein